MTDPEVPETAADQQKLKEIVSKDSKAGRSMTGPWLWLCSVLGVGMLLFYMYCAARPVDTQYFLGTYVLITYLLICLSYPFTAKPRKTFGFYIDSVIPFITLGLTVYFALHFLLGSQGAREPFTGLNWFYAIVSLIAAGVFFIPVRVWGKNEGHAPIAMDIFLALAAVFVVGYFIVEYAAINYRMGSETPLDTAVSFIGILVSLEVARRVLGWSMTLVGVIFLLYAFFGDLLHNIPVLNAFAHTGFKVPRTLNHIYFKQEGVFGIMATVLVTYVILFIFFGSFLKYSGASRFFLDLPMAMGKSRKKRLAPEYFRKDPKKMNRIT